MHTEGPSILFLDIETQPDLVYTWGVYEENAIEVKEHWQVLTFSAKWYHGTHITKGLCDYKGYKAGCSDKHLIRELWHLLDKADIVVGHNAKKFDIKKLNARFIVHGMKPPRPYAIVDTKTEVKRVAGFSSNKLDWLCAQLGIGRKMEHQGFPVWRGCMLGDMHAWEVMKKYNRQDVVLLEQLYLTLAPWMKQPNAGMWVEKTVCSNPSCMGQDMSYDGYRRNATTLYHRVICNTCGLRMRVPVPEIRTKPLIPL